MGHEPNAFLQLLPLILVIALYFLPTIIAIKKKHIHKTPIILINIFGGFIGLGWVIALVWCFITQAPAAPVSSKAEELERLDKLRNNGVITDQEFETQKQAVLSR